MKKPLKSLLDRFSWFGYPLVAVLLGGLLGRAAGRHPRGLDPLTVLSPRGSELLVDVCWIGLAFVVAVAVLGFLLGLAGGEGGPRSRLANGMGAAAFAVSGVLIFVGGGFLLCSALVFLSLWAGMGAGSPLGALLGASSVALVIGIGLFCLRPVGRVLGKKKLEAMANAEEDTF
jgi:hypothetical protein